MANEIAAVPTGSAVEPCCCSGTCGIECRSRGGTATLCGFSEYASPSNPPKKFRDQGLDGGFCFEDNGNHPDCADCSGMQGPPGCTTPSSGVNGSIVGILNASREEFSGNYTFAAADCAETNNQAHDEGVAGAPALCGSIPMTPQTQPPRDFEANLHGVPADVTTLQTSKTWAMTGECTFMGLLGGLEIWRVGVGTVSKTLTVEDTEDDAIDRLLVGQDWPAFDIGWLDKGSVACGECCIAKWGLRGAPPGQFSFAYQESQFRLNVAIPSGEFRTVDVEILRRAIGDTEWAVYQTFSFTAEGNSEGQWTSAVQDVPNQRGYETTVGDCTVSEYIA